MIAENLPSSTPNSFPQSEINVGPCFGIINGPELTALNDLPGSAIRVYIALAQHANPHGYCWPGRQRLATLTNLHVDQVSRALTQLEEAGLIKRLGRSRYLLPLHGSLTKPTAPKPASRQNCQTEQTTLNKPTERASTPAPEPVPLSVPKVKIETRTTLPEDWELPQEWLEQAQQDRPDLPIEVIQASARNFKDYHLAQGRQASNWRYEWTRWIRRERPPKRAATAQPPTSPPVRPVYQPPAKPTYEERVQNWERWAAEMRQKGGRLDLIEAARPRPPA